MIVVVTGVAGAGKTTIAARLAERLGWPFLEADDLHPAANREKMERGEPLTEEDRRPWLERMAEAIRRTGDPAVVSCSCLRRAHRRRLRAAHPAVRFVHLRIDPDTARERVGGRAGHYFGPGLIESQFATLEEPAEAHVLDAIRPPGELVDELVEWIASGRGRPAGDGGAGSQSP